MCFSDKHNEMGRFFQHLLFELKINKKRMFSVCSKIRVLLNVEKDAESILIKKIKHLEIDRRLQSGGCSGICLGRVYSF